MNGYSKPYLALAVLACMLLLSACGQKGDLYIPDKNAAAAAASGPHS